MDESSWRYLIDWGLFLVQNIYLSFLFKKYAEGRLVTENSCEIIGTERQFNCFIQTTIFKQ